MFSLVTDEAKLAYSKHIHKYIEKKIKDDDKLLLFLVIYVVKK